MSLGGFKEKGKIGLTCMLTSVTSYPINANKGLDAVVTHDFDKSSATCLLVKERKKKMYSKIYSA